VHRECAFEGDDVGLAAEHRRDRPTPAGGYRLEGAGGGRGALWRELAAQESEVGLGDDAGRVGAESLSELAAQAYVGGEGFGLAAARGQRLHQQGGERLVRGSVPDGVAQGVDDVVVEQIDGARGPVAGGERALHPDRQKVREHASERPDGWVGGVNGPQREPLGGKGSGQGVVARRARCARSNEAVLRQDGVDLEIACVEAVPAGVGGDGQAEPAGTGDQGLERAGRIGWRSARPHSFDQVGDSYDPPTREQQGAQQRGQPGSLDGPPVNRQGSEHGDLHRDSISQGPGWAVTSCDAGDSAGSTATGSAAKGARPCSVRDGQPDGHLSVQRAGLCLGSLVAFLRAVVVEPVHIELVIARRPDLGEVGRTGERTAGERTAGEHDGTS
jgi:hypothetical protein